MKKPRIVLAFAFGFLIAIRIFFQNSEHLTTIVAMINTIALFVVLFDIAERIKEKILRKITTMCAAKSIALREKNTFTRLFYFIIIIFGILFVILYFIFGLTNLGNDIISISALAISILSDEIITLGTYLYRV